ncbi:YceI family protein [Janthinobacterium psychrotolerans]|uniref:YceI-like domain-containing protein n=1 Tax=Janthinobacterium psychrotolerans TaxID=1747903 RepID=A0A1A7BYB2_9BURK|nr:YceI family protein [Janthinobacterium psychrotolerans]OBV38512.1 YceI-like domain-containing protein [Janthinobacterium psychrotolerans]
MRHPCLLLTCLLLAACTPLAVTPPAPASQATVSAPLQAPARDENVLAIDSQATLLTITVRRGGALARLGHDHVVASRTVTGWVAPQLKQADFQFRLDAMSVDESALRQRAGLETTPSAEAIAGTRHNMLVRVLDAERYPDVRVQATLQAGANAVDAAITLHGVTRQVVVPVTLAQAPDGRGLRASGAFVLKQSDFGIVPFSIMGGAMAVQDQMELAFDIVAGARASAPGSASAPAR